jgi:hypothetical protein
MHYDVPIAALAVAGKSCAVLHQATCEIIQQGERPQDVLRKYKVKKLEINHIDIIDVAPLSASLKIYGGRLHVKKMQDLPFPPGTVLSPEQIAIVRWYCLNDLDATETLYLDLEKEINLRETMGKEYNLDLRSKSDAQIAETVISQEVSRRNNRRPSRPVIIMGTSYRYKAPQFLQFNSPNMQWTFNVAKSALFVVGEGGSVGMPPELNELAIPIGKGVYRMGIGGLHSSEKCVTHVSDEEFILLDRDVESYYPAIILNLGLFPAQLGTNFLTVYRGIVNRRLAAKKAKNKVVADSLKITVNGTYGKLGSKYSVLYAPDLSIQVTITGQLSLLMLIERLELQGVEVLSANTDGIVVRCPRKREAEVEGIFKQWEADTGFKTEEVRYKSIHSRDVNSYIAIKEAGGTKAKGAYSSASLHKNPTNSICVRAVEAFLMQGTPLETTVLESRDIREFVTVRQVKGGAVKVQEDLTEYLGKAIRWYYAKDISGEIVYARSGNKVPRSEGAKPLMVLPDTFPEDVDHAWYCEEAERMLRETGYYGEVELSDITDE